MTSTIEQRVTDLESGAYRADHDRERLTMQIGHVGGAVDTLSGDLRALDHQVRTEVLPRLDTLADRMSGLEDRMGDLEERMGGLERGMTALLSHFGITPESG